MAKNNDFSNRSVVIMLVLVILVSLVSLGVYLSAVDGASPTYGNTQQSHGVVMLEITDGPPILDQSDSTSGMAAIEIK